MHQLWKGRCGLLITEFIEEDSPLLPNPCHFQDYDLSMFPLSLVLSFRVQERSRVSGLLRVSGFGRSVWGLGNRVYGYGFRVWGFRVYGV